MTDKPMIPSEETTAGAVRQSSETADQCPKCGTKYPEPFAIEGPWRYYNQILHDEDGPECLRRQLTQARERVARETSEIINAVRALPGELQGQGTLADAIRVLVAHNAQLRRVVEQVEWVEPPDAHPGLGRWCPTCRAWESDGHEVHCPYYGGQVNGILADAPGNPYAAVVEAARHDYSSARTACDYRRGAGGCEAWIKRGRTCPDCPLESFDALSGALAAIDGDTIATCANGTRLEALGGGADSGTTKHTSDDPPPPHRTHTDAPGVSEGGGLDPGSQGAANRTAGEGSDSA